MVDNNAFIQQIIDKGKADAKQRNTGELGKDDFLSLLILQLRYQDPLNPVEDKEFIAQMAQFSALEQMQNMNASNTAMKGFSMIGKYVNAVLADEATGVNREVEGHVESVLMNGSKTFVIVAGKQIPIENVYNVADGYNPLNSSLSAYTGLIGYVVNGAVFDITTGEVVGVSGEVASLLKGVYEDYAMLNGVNAVIAGLNVNGEIVEDRARIKEYLANIDSMAKTEDRHIEVFVTDDNGKRVPIGATLRSFEIDPVFGTVKAVLDDVATPVASVAAIRKATDAAVQGAQNTNGAEGTDKGTPDGTGQNGASETNAANADDHGGDTGEPGIDGPGGGIGGTGIDDPDAGAVEPDGEEQT